MGVQPGVYWPSQTTWFRASRSIVSSSASRTRGSLASGVPRSPGAAGGLPFLFQVDVERRVADPRHAGDLELAFRAEARRVGRIHQVHEIDVAGAKVRQPD